MLPKIRPPAVEKGDMAEKKPPTAIAANSTPGLRPEIAATRPGTSGKKVILTTFPLTTKLNNAEAIARNTGARPVDAFAETKLDSKSTAPASAATPIRMLIPQSIIATLHGTRASAAFSSATLRSVAATAHIVETNTTSTFLVRVTMNGIPGTKKFITKGNTKIATKTPIIPQCH